MNDIQAHRQDSTATPARSKAPRRPRRAMRRLNLNLPESLYSDIEALAAEDGKTITDILRLGLGLAHLAATEKAKGGHLAIIDANKQVHRIVMPY